MAPANDASYVFISYAHADSKEVLPTIQAMESSNISLWYDNGIEAGSEWPEFIASKVMNCRKFVLFVSKAYLASQNCKRELNFAISRKKEILSIFLEEVELSPGMEMQLGTYQAIFRDRFTDNTTFAASLIKEPFFNDCRASAPAKPAAPVEPAAPVVEKKPETVVSEDKPAEKPADHSSDLLASLTGLIANQTSDKPAEPAKPAEPPKPVKPAEPPKPVKPAVPPKPAKPAGKSEEPAGPSPDLLASLSGLMANQPSTTPAPATEKKAGTGGSPSKPVKPQPPKSYGTTPQPQQPPKTNSNLPVKNKWVAFLLAFFLGSFGAHKFYLGQKGMGFLYLVFFWTYIPGLISFFEAIGLLLQKEEDFAQKYNCRIG